MICEKCGNEIKTGESFCTNCGNCCLKENRIQKNESSKNNRKLLIILIHVFVLIVSGILFYVLNNKNDKNLEKVDEIGDKYSKVVFACSTKYVQIDPNDIKYFMEDEKEETKNIEIIGTFSGRSVSYMDGMLDFVIYGKNNNNYPVTITFNFNVYDSDNYRLDKKTGKVYIVNANSEFAIKMDLGFKDLRDTNFKKYNITFFANKPESYYEIANICKENLVVKEAEKYSENVLLVSYKNDSEKAVSNILVLVKYYDDNNKLLFVDTKNINKILNDIKPNETEEISFEIKDFKYNNYDVQVFGSYFYNKSDW